MLRLEPSEQFTVVRQIGRHTDSNTYFVQAVIRNSRTDEVLDTVNLDDQGNQRFTQDWQVPADTSGQGFYIDITTSVYTDSGYTTKSPNYADETETYLIQTRYNPNLGGGGGYNFTPDEVRGIVEEKVKEALGQQNLEEKIEPVLEQLRAIERDLRSDTELSETKRAVRELNQKVDRIEIPDYESELQQIKKMIRDLPEPERNKKLLKEKFKNLASIFESYQDKFEEMEDLLNDLVYIKENIDSRDREKIEKVNKLINKLTEAKRGNLSEINKRAQNLVR